MTTKVTKESLAEKIKYLESVSKLGLSLNEEYQLKAYRKLHEYLEDEELEILVERSWDGVGHD